MSARPALNHESPEPHERDTAKKLIASLSDVIAQRYFTGLTYRDVHVKGHAAVEAEFVVEPNLASEFRVGVFSEPRTFTAWIRFSNSNQDPAMDIKGDIRGFAMKIMGVEGEKLLDTQRDASTHDFIFLSTNVFLTKDAKDFYELVRSGALNHRKSLADYLRTAKYFVTHPRVGVGLLRALRKFASLLEM